MKKIYTIISLLLLALYASANPVSKELAKKVAINFFSAKKSSAIDTFQVTNIYTHFEESKEAFYIFSFPKGGFVIVSADDEANPIIGYSLTSPATNKIDNPVIISRFDRYAKQINYAAKAKLNKSDVKAEWKQILEGSVSKGIKGAGPLLQTTWDQSPYYNQLCPTGTPTGCVATAMSQIMRYHNWPATGNGWHKYVHATYGSLFANFQGTDYDWANMPTSLSSGNTIAEKIAVAELCYHAGVSVNMNYATNGSGAYSPDVLYALTSYFKYDPTTINIYTFNVAQQTDWINRVKAEIDAGRPVYYSGSSQADGGHAWVCDGYDGSTDKLHINWGWGGYYNGYFAANAMNPDTYSFSEQNSMITGIKPGISTQKMQFILQASAFNTASRGIQYISAVSNRTAWAVAYDGSGSNAKVKDFTKTNDGGLTWVSGTINTSSTTNYTAAMISAVNENTAWVPLFGPSGGGMIVKTTDGGKNWVKQASAAFAAPDGFPNVIHFWDANNGFCMGDPNGGYFEIYTTTNGGNAWNRVSSSNIPANLSGEYGVVGLYDVFGDIAWFTTNKGRLFKSLNKGASWQVFQTPYDSQFEIAFKDENIGVAMGKISDVVKYYRTTNGGENWSEITPTGNFYTADFTYIPNTDTLISAGVASPNIGLSFSTDNGTTFQEYADFYKNYQFTSLGASPAGTVWAGSFNSSKYYGGMWKKGESLPSANFTINKTSVPRNDSTVIITDASYGNIDSWEWNFGADASPATLSEKGPHKIKYTSVGDKNITLTITKASDIQVFVKEKAINVTWATSVDTETNNTAHYLYPNPANSELYVKIKGFEKGNIQVYSISGALMWQSDGITDDNRINISNLASGIYIVKIKDSNGSISSRKLTISR